MFFCILITMGRNSYFQFKQFKIEQGGCAMKVGTDGVLLGAWTEVENKRQVLDIGTGSGLIALMIAQRNADAAITGIDIEDGAYNQAKENAADSPWNKRIEIVKTSLQNFTPDSKFDLIVCNPPYFTNSLKNPVESRSIARHSDSLPLEELASNVCRLLHSGGTFAVILPVEESEKLKDIGIGHGLFAKRICKVIPKTGADVKRIMTEYTTLKTDTKEEVLQIENETRHEYTNEFKAITKDFYLDK